MKPGAKDDPRRTCGVLGGRGFVGSAVVEEARRQGFQVDVIDVAEYDGAVGKSYDILVNANGNSKKFLAKQDPAGEFDLSVRSVARSLQDFHAGLYIHLSSIDVYPDHTRPDASAETAGIDPGSLAPYGFHKLLAEQLVRFYAGNWLVLRMGGFVGKGLWKNSIHDILKGEPIRVHPDSEYQYLNTRDLARVAFDLAGSGTAKEIFNVCGDGVISLRQVAAMVKGHELAACPKDLPRERYEINIAKVKARCEIPPTRETVRRFIEDVLAGKETVR